MFCLILPDRLKYLIKILSFLITFAVMAYSIVLFASRPHVWACGASNLFVLDNLSGFIAMAVSLFAFLITTYSLSFMEGSYGRYFGYALITLGGSLGALFANDLIGLLVFWGILALTLYLLVTIRPTDKASASAKKALIIIGGTDSLMILGIGIIWVLTGSLSMDKISIALDGPLPYIAFLCLVIAAFAKAGVMPFHSWLPDVAEDGPTPVTAYLPASLDKLLGIYLLARISLGLFRMNAASNMMFALSGAVTIVFAVIFALVQHDMKRLLGYHAVSQVGYMILGIGTGSAIGIAGAIFHMLNNAIYKSCLFLCGGCVEKRTGTTDLERLGGLAVYMPITFVSFLIASLSISGIPPFNGFVSKWMIYQGIIESARSGGAGLWIIWLCAAMFGSALTLASFMKLIHAVFLGRPSRDFASVKEAPAAMTFPVVTLAASCAIFGVFAFSIPLPAFIAPAAGLPIQYLGTWSPVLATILIFAGMALGLIIYSLSNVGKGYRSTAVFVGGESHAELGRVSGVNFYDTIKDLKWLNWLYRKEEAKAFDIYEEGAKVTFGFSRILQWLHNGILPTYLVWCLLGMLFLFFSLMR